MKKDKTQFEFGKRKKVSLVAAREKEEIIGSVGKCKERERKVIENVTCRKERKP